MSDSDSKMSYSLKTAALEKALLEDPESGAKTAPPSPKSPIINWLKQVLPLPQKTEAGLREAIEEYIVEQPDIAATDPINLQERILFLNILNLRDVKVYDIMVARAEIAAIEIDTNQEELLELLSKKQYTRFPVYKGTLDEIIGSVHLKDIVAALSRGEQVHLKDMLSDIPVIAPSLPIIDLLLIMRRTSRHIALVVDEYGGIDGLVTIGDVIETIIGEIDDEHADDEDPQIIENSDGTVLVDARLSLAKFEERYGALFTQSERDDSDTLSGLVFAIAGHIPARGEVITHSSGMAFEIVEADPRKISRLKIGNIPPVSYDL